jgi:hypothetical protein
LLNTNLFLSEIISNLLCPIPSISDHYIKFSDAVQKSSNLGGIGWFDQMGAQDLKFLQNTKKQGIPFYPGSLPTLDVFKISMINKECKEKVEQKF